MGQLVGQSQSQGCGASRAVGMGCLGVPRISLPGRGPRVVPSIELRASGRWRSCCSSTDAGAVGGTIARRRTLASRPKQSSQAVGSRRSLCPQCGCSPAVQPGSAATMMPCSRADPTACAMSRRPSSCHALPTWLSAVESVTNTRSACSGVRRSARHEHEPARSRGVSCSSSAGGLSGSVRAASAGATCPGSTPAAS